MRAGANASNALGIDIHAHYVPSSFPTCSTHIPPSGWPSAEHVLSSGGVCQCHVLVDGKHYRTVSEKCWNPLLRVADLSAMGLARQAISPMPELLSYPMELKPARRLLRHVNEQMADCIAQSNGALIGLGAVPLQDIEAAIDELHYNVHTLGFAGIEIGSNVCGRPLGDLQLLPFFQACEALGAAVFVHAYKPAALDRLSGPPPLQQVLAYPSDVGLAAASVLTSGLLLRCPNLRLAFSHGGGTLASLLPRLEKGWSVFPALHEHIPISPREQAQRLFFDSLVFDPATLRHLVATVGAGQVLLGTDYPFNFREPEPVVQLFAAGFDGTTCAALLHRNAERFLGLTPSP
ncbi:amidohydrolase family protein [Pseudomonas sp. MWU13-2105]|uniref:amidohydrolase family protein n=1 Tax=Pseudomonas sp. MWU13-2105 TaxID=2935074 RepID=UPI00200F4842|nr:amidohydrolase family protein [Pseudomonas sp. MWU13-2105]